MNTSMKLISIAAMTSAGAIAAAASAGMSMPAFSGPGSTYQCWSFDTPSTPTPADAGFVNPFGAPQMLPSSGATWTPADANKNGVWQLGTTAAGGSDFLNFRIPNMADPTKQKLFSIEVKYFGGISGTPPVDPVVSGIGFGLAPEAITFTGFTTRPADNNPSWVIGTWTGFLNECPPIESIFVTANSGGFAPSLIDWVCINTLCVPTPGAGALVMAGAMAMGVRRRRA